MNSVNSTDIFAPPPKPDIKDNEVKSDIADKAEIDKSKRENLDWIALRVLLAIVTLVVLYVVFQPLIWSEGIGKPLPTGSPDFAELLAIVIAIMGLALAGFGVVTYQFTQRRAEASLEERATVLKKQLAEEAAVANARLYTNISVQAYIAYEKLWSSQGYTLQGLEDKEVQLYVDSALDNARQAYEQFLNLSKERLQTYRQGYAWCKANYMYFLATKKVEQGKAFALARELKSEPKLEESKRECIAWCYLRFSPPGKAEWKEGLTILAEVMNSADISDEAIREARKNRYRGVFNKSVINDIENALDGKSPLP